MKLIIHKHTPKILIVLICIIALGTSFFLMLSSWEAHRRAGNFEADPYADYESDVVSYEGETYTLRDDLETILLIGVDKFEADTGQESYNNMQQADFLLLLILDHKNETYKALWLNRDTMTEITVLGVRGENAGSFTGQLALAHTYGSGGRDSCRNTVEAVSHLLYGVKIDHYIAVTMDAVAEINDLSGGVQIEMLEDFSSFDPEMSKGAVVNLQGEQALIYVRTRKGLDDSTNLSRMTRQQQYLNALNLKIHGCMEQDETFVLNAASKISEYMESDYTAEQLSRLFDKTEQYQNLGITTLEGQAVQGKEYMEYYVDEDAIKAFIIGNFYKPQVETEQP